MDTTYLLLWLEAPLQSWGYESKFGRRDTLDFPTKSGVLGLICCGLGAGGEQAELLATLSPLSQTAIAYVRTRANHADNASERLKRDREPLLRDFHMVGSGYDDQDPWKNLLIPKTSDGKKAVGGGAKMTYRYYLQDAFFAVVVEIPKTQADMIATALTHPTWDLYLGRKSCVPTDFIYRGQFDTEALAIAHASGIAKEKELAEDFRVLEGEHEGEILTLNDVPLQFGERKLYRDRRVTVVQSYSAAGADK